MEKEDARKIAQQLRIPKYMRDTDAALEGLVKFGRKVAEIEREALAAQKVGAGETAPEGHNAI